MTPRKFELQRDNILNVALELITEQGVDAVSMSTLAQMTGLSRPALYQYFSSREHILGELLINDMADLSNEIDRIVGDLDDPEEQIRVWVHYCLAHLASSHHKIIRDISVHSLPEDQRGELMAMHGYFLTTLISPLSRMGVADPGAVCNMVFGVVNASASRIEQGNSFTSEAAALEKFVFAGIQAELIQ